MTKNNKYAVQEKPNLDFAKIPHRSGLTYEFELKVCLPAFLEKHGENLKKGESIPKAPDFKSPERNKIFSYFFDNSGHVFFDMKIKEGNKVIGNTHVGFSGDAFPKEQDIKKTKIGVPGVVMDQAKWDSTHHYTKTFKLSRENFDNLAAFVEKSAENPPNFHWPLAMNCARFAKRAAKAAGIKNAGLVSVANLPETSIAFIKASKLVKKIEKAAKKIGRVFSSERKVNLSKQDVSTKMIVAAKQNKR